MPSSMVLHLHPGLSEARMPASRLLSSSRQQRISLFICCRFGRVHFSLSDGFHIGYRRYTKACLVTKFILATASSDPCQNNGTLNKHLDPDSIYQNIVGSDTGINSEINVLCIHLIWETAATNAFSNDADIAKYRNGFESWNSTRKD